MLPETIDKILQVRKLSKDLMEADMARAKETLALEQAILDGLTDKLSSAIDQLARNHTGTPVSAHEFVLLAGCCLELQTLVENHTNLINQSEADFEQKRKRLVEANVQYRSIENVKVKAESRLCRAGERLEQKELDAIAIRSRGQAREI